MIILIVVQLMTIGMFLLFGYLILKKEMYGLISGFETKSEEEQQELIKNGYPQANARGLLHSGYILIAGLILYLIGVPYAVEISWGVMIVYLFAYLLYVNKLDAARVRKRNFIFLVCTIVFTLGIIGFVIILGMQPNQLTVSETEVQISGTYGVDWPLEGITNVELYDELPKVQMRTNGFAAEHRLKGRFRLEDFGNGQLFLYRNNPPYILIERGDDYLFINAKKAETTVQWYETVSEAVN